MLHGLANQKLILFNGPRHSGKDTAANHVWSSFPDTMRFKMSRPLKDGIKAFFNLTDAQVAYLESKKTEPDELLFQNSYVDVQISMSEYWAKDKFGMRVFGKLAFREIQKSPSKIFVCSDSGFDYEAAPLLPYFGISNVLLVRLHREGKTFAGDSRGYIELPGVRTLEMSNDSSTTHFCEQVKEIVSIWLSL
jgi:hypothetical protein